MKEKRNKKLFFLSFVFLGLCFFEVWFLGIGRGGNFLLLFVLFCFVLFFEMIVWIREQKRKRGAAKTTAQKKGVYFSFQKIICMVFSYIFFSFLDFFVCFVLFCVFFVSGLFFFF